MSSDSPIELRTKTRRIRKRIVEIWHSGTLMSLGAVCKIVKYCTKLNANLLC